MAFSILILPIQPRLFQSTQIDRFAYLDQLLRQKIPTIRAPSVL